MQYNGYGGKILRVDLTSGSIGTEDLDEEMVKKYLGGMGINTKLAYDLIKPGIDPLSNENPIIIGAGALDGTMVPSASKVHVTTKFPVNGAIGSACGCNFGPMLKWAGYDHIIITGASDKPVCLEIFDDEVKLCDASELWGKDIHETNDVLHAKLGENISNISIGQAGENLAKTSMAFIDDMAHLGRGGLGAVMGSKKLKAIVTRGTKGVKVADREKLYDLFQITKNKTAKGYFKAMQKLGLVSVIDTWIKHGVILDDLHGVKPPVDEAIKKWGKEAFTKVIDSHPWASFGCITCDKIVARVKEGSLADLTTTLSCGIQPHYFMSFGVSVAEAVKLAGLFDDYGLDILDGTVNLELVLKLYKEGAVTKKDLGMDFKPDAETLAKAIEAMAYKRGFWGIVADGIPSVKKEIKVAEEYLRNVDVKGLAVTMDSRVCLGMEGFSMLTQPRGGQTSVLIRTPSTAIPGIPIPFLKTIFATYQVPEKAMKRIFSDDDIHVGRATVWAENLCTAYNCLGICYRFTINSLYQPVVAAEYYRAVTGRTVSPQKIVETGNRVWNLQKALNVREGIFSRKDDGIPESWVTEPIKSEEGDIYLQNYPKTKRIKKKEAEELLDGYYDERGWDIKTGNPTRQSLEKLKLNDVADNLEKLGKL